MRSNVGAPGIVTRQSIRAARHRAERQGLADRVVDADVDPAGLGCREGQGQAHAVAGE